jgi:hypothetical protein
MGYEGLIALRDFVEDGGTLIALGSASTVPIEFAMARGVSLRSHQSELFSPGVDRPGRGPTAVSHPLFWV